MILSFSAVILFIAPYATAHLCAFSPGMYAFNGTSGTDNPNNADPCGPLYMLPKKKGYWMHDWNGVPNFPPAPGAFLELPAGGSFKVPIAGNKAQTPYSYEGRYMSNWGDGKQHDEPYTAWPACFSSPNMHCKNESDAAGTAFAISYTSNLDEVTLENLVVFTVAKETPFRLWATYQVPALPLCPPEGCHCVWGWSPNHCGTPNIYMLPYRCKVTGTPGDHPLKLPAVAPVWCEDDESKCVKGPKQIIVYNQLEGNNVVVTGYQKDNDEKAPGYNMKMGFHDGAQNDIFDESVTLPPGTPGGITPSGSTPSGTTPSGSTPTSSTSKRGTPLPGNTTTTGGNSTGVRLVDDSNFSSSPSPSPSSSPSLSPSPSPWPTPSHSMPPAANNSSASHCRPRPSGTPDGNNTLAGNTTAPGGVNGTDPVRLADGSSSSLSPSSSPSSSSSPSPSSNPSLSPTPSPWPTPSPSMSPANNSSASHCHSRPSGHKRKRLNSHRH